MIQGSIELFAKIFGSGEDMSQSKHLVGRGFGLLAHGAIHVAGAAWAKTGGKAANKLGGLAWEKTVGSFRNTHDRAKDSAKHNIATAKYQQRIESRSEVKAANQRKAEATKGIQQEFQSNIKNFQRESEMDRPGIYQTGGNEAEHTTSLPSGNTATSSSTTENHSMSVPGLPGMEGRDGKDGQKGDRGERGFRGFEGKPGAPGINSSDSNSTDGGNKK